MKNKLNKVLFTVVCSFLIVSAGRAIEIYNLVVASDGRGDYVTIQEAVNATRDFKDQRTIIFIKNGIYREKLVIPSWKTKISFIGESVENTIIDYDDYSGKDGLRTFTSYTVKVLGNDFYAENITFQNSAGPVGQTVALHIEADRCVFRNCRFLGNQDTMYAAGEGSRQLYSNCYIEGTTDFIFGAATAVFENCHIHSKKNSYVTAASTPEGAAYGYVFLNCKLTADSSLNKVYLGRPWRAYARVVYIKCALGAHIVPEGWNNWSKPERESTAYYAEYQNTGPGSDTTSRVSWSKQLTDKEAEAYTLDNILSLKNIDDTPYKNWYNFKIQ